MSDAIYANAEFNPYSHPDWDAELLEQFGFIPGLKEWLLVRQVHALEHATVWILSEARNFQQGESSASYLGADNETIGGLSTDRGFYLYGEIDPLKLRRAVNLALFRLQQGDSNLAIHPRCGTNSSVTAMLTTSMAMVAHFSLPKEPLHQIMGMGLAALTANCLAADLGMYVQKYITTAIPFNLKLQKITKITDKSGNSGYFIRLKWVDA